MSVSVFVSVESDAAGCADVDGTVVSGGAVSVRVLPDSVGAIIAVASVADVRTDDAVEVTVVVVSVTVSEHESIPVCAVSAITVVCGISVSGLFSAMAELVSVTSTVTGCAVVVPR